MDANDQGEKIGKYTLYKVAEAAPVCRLHGCQCISVVQAAVDMEAQKDTLTDERDALRDVLAAAELIWPGGKEVPADPTVQCIVPQWRIEELQEAIAAYKQAQSALAESSGGREDGHAS